jgi:hypothetical protein
MLDDWFMAHRFEFWCDFWMICIALGLGLAWCAIKVLDSWRARRRK